MDLLSAYRVGVACGGTTYPSRSPFDPSARYPEYPFSGGAISSEPNYAYDLVRESLELLGLDEAHRGDKSWNPLGGVVRPGDKVVIKPNMVREFRESNPGHDDCVFTHGSVIRAVVDYAYIALEGRGRIVIADASHNDADFDILRRETGLDGICELYSKEASFDLEVYDLRPEKADKVDGVIVGHSPLPGDPAGYVKVNLGLNSAFAEINDLCHLLYGSEYDTSELVSHQHDDVHEYLISKTVLDADVVISLPKLKTHKKVALTVNLKNLVGINGNKNWLPHHREGTPSQGGDQFCDDAVINKIERGAVAKFKRIFPLLGPLRPLIAGPIKAVGKMVFGDTNKDRVRSGNWYGNDTTWRMVLDLNRILHYADSEGVFSRQPVRRFFSIVDGLVGGEGSGPLDPTKKPAGVVLSGANPVAVDMICARLMGFDYHRVPMLSGAFKEHDWPLVNFAATDVESLSRREEYRGVIDEMPGPFLGFRPHFGWEGHVEA